jgi:hypothetical protein
MLCSHAHGCKCNSGARHPLSCRHLRSAGSPGVVSIASRLGLGARLPDLENFFDSSTRADSFNRVRHSLQSRGAVEFHAERQGFGVSRLLTSRHLWPWFAIGANTKRQLLVCDGANGRLVNISQRSAEELGGQISLRFSIAVAFHGYGPPQLMQYFGGGDTLQSVNSGICR